MKLICGWCYKEFEINQITNKNGERSLLICPHCSRTLPSSKKKQTDNLVGARHIHEEWKNGDIVI